MSKKKCCKEKEISTENNSISEYGVSRPSLNLLYHEILSAIPNDITPDDPEGQWNSISKWLIAASQSFLRAKEFLSYISSSGKRAESILANDLSNGFGTVGDALVESSISLLPENENMKSSKNAGLNAINTLIDLQKIIGRMTFSHKRVLNQRMHLDFLSNITNGMSPILENLHTIDSNKKIEGMHLAALVELKQMNINVSAQLYNMQYGLYSMNPYEAATKLASFGLCCKQKGCTLGNSWQECYNILSSPSLCSPSFQLTGSIVPITRQTCTWQVVKETYNVFACYRTLLDAFLDVSCCKVKILNSSKNLPPVSYTYVQSGTGTFRLPLQIKQLC